MSFVDVILLATDANLFSYHLSVPYFGVAFWALRGPVAGCRVRLFTINRLDFQ